MDQILIITLNQRNLGIFAHSQNNQMLHYILQKKDSIFNSLKGHIMLVSQDPQLLNKTGSNQQ